MSNVPSPSTTPISSRTTAQRTQVQTASRSGPPTVATTKTTTTTRTTTRSSSEMARTTQLTIITRSKSLNRPTVNVQNVSLVSRASSTMVVALSVVLSALAAILLVLVLLFSVRYYRNTKRRASRELTASGGGRGSGIIHRERSTRRPPVVVGTLDELPIGSNGESGGLQSWIANATSGGRTNEPSSSSAVATTTMVEQVSNRTTVSSGSDNGRGNRPFRIPRKPPPTNTPSGRENVSSMILDAPISGFDSGGIEDSKAEEVETEIRHGTDPIPIPFAKLMRKETDSTCSDTPIQPGVMEERNVEFVESERAEKAMSVSSTFPMSTSSRPSPSEASRPWPVVRTISDVAVSRGVKVGHIASNFPLVYCPEPHEGHLSARGSIHSGATHEVGPNDSERVRTMSFPLGINERTPILLHGGGPRYLLTPSDSEAQVQFPIRSRVLLNLPSPTSRSVPTTPRAIDKNPVRARSSSSGPIQSSNIP